MKHGHPIHTPLTHYTHTCGITILESDARESHMVHFSDQISCYIEVSLNELQKRVSFMKALCYLSLVE